MKLQDQVCTLEQAKKLKELGVKQESLFCFIGDDNPDPKYNLPHDLYYSYQAREEFGASWWEHRIAAFTVAELGAMLPGVDISKGEFMYFSMGSKGGHWFIDYNGSERKTIECKGEDDLFEMKETEAGARAEMLIYLLENKLITIDEVNDRLQ